MTFSEALDPATVNAGNRMVWSYDGHFYTLTDSCRRPGARRETEAQALGGHLVTVNDAAEQQWLQRDLRALRQHLDRLHRPGGGGHLAVGQRRRPLAYTNWAVGEPIQRQRLRLRLHGVGGQWRNGHNTYTYRGIIELATADTDADGLPAGLDPYPGDPLNACDLRAAGVDGIFDTADDVIYRLTLASAYTGGTSVSLFINGGPLPNGHYRFTANNTLTDVVGNALDGDGDGTGGDLYSRTFTVALPAGPDLGRRQQRHPGHGHAAAADRGPGRQRPVHAARAWAGRTRWPTIPGERSGLLALRGPGRGYRLA